MENSIILNVLSAIGGGGLAAFLTYRLGNRKQDESEFISIVGEYKQLTKEYKVEVIELRKEVENLRQQFNLKEKEITQLRNQLMIFESSHADVPIPIWLKDVEGKMLYLNSEYEQTILHPIGKSLEDYIGHKDVDVWGEKIAKQFLSHDKRVMREKKSIEFTENWLGANGDKFEGRIIKYPRFLNKTVIGIGGVVLDINKVE